MEQNPSMRMVVVRHPPPLASKETIDWGKYDEDEMTPTAKTADRGLAGHVLDAAILIVNVLESARSGTLNPKEQAESAQ